MRSTAFEDPDEDIVRQVATGDSRAVAILIDRHLEMVMGLSYRMLGTRQDAEDVTQEVFLKVWSQAKAWQPGGAKFQTWIYRVCVNQCLDRLKKKKELLVDTLPDQADEKPSALSKLEADEKSDRVQSAVGDLPERQRAALVLCHFQGMSNQEAADIMSVSVEALESLLARARRGLKRALLPEKEGLLSD